MLDAAGTKIHQLCRENFLQASWAAGNEAMRHGSVAGTKRCFCSRLIPLTASSGTHPPFFRPLRSCRLTTDLEQTLLTLGALFDSRESPLVGGHVLADDFLLVFLPGASRNPVLWRAG